ncbi:YcxB-like protein [Oribacterium sp. WCC10]|nr:YcxB-like protein [Oribacterium sp. WCC10]
METASKWTIEELKKYQWATLFSMHKGYICFILILDILSMIAAVTAFHYGYRILTAEFIIFILIIPLVIYLITMYRVKKNYKSSKFLQTTVTTFKFAEDRFEAISERGHSVIRYDDLYKVIETKTNFYLYISNNQALTVIKANCSDELVSFLKKLSKSKGKISDSRTAHGGESFSTS